MIEWIRERRSCRRFSSKPLPMEVKGVLEEACLRSPTSKNRRPWHFVFVEQRSLQTALSVCKPHGAAFLEEAPLNVVIAADPALSDVWVEDCAIAATLLQMTAQSLGLGSCWCQIRLRETENGHASSDIVKEILQLPVPWEIASIIGIGYPFEESPVLEERPLPKDRCHYRPDPSSER